MSIKSITSNQILQVTKMSASLLSRLFQTSEFYVKRVICRRENPINQTWTRAAFFRRRKEKEIEATPITEKEPILKPPKPLRKKIGLQTVRSYVPPADVNDRIKRITMEVCGNIENWSSYEFENNYIKFKLLTLMMSEFDHFIPNVDLTNIRSIQDTVQFFSTPVRDTSSYEDLAKLDLPRNLHIQLEPLRFDPATDTMFGGISAFPDRPTIVTSLRYKKKYGKKV